MNIISSWYIANNFIKKSLEEKNYITTLKLNCLIYLLYSSYLYKYEEKIFVENFIKTEKGPVLPNINFKFGCFKDKVITKYAKDSSGNIITLKEFGEFELELSYIWNKYKNMSDIEILHIVNKGIMISNKNNNEIINDKEILADEIKRNEEILKRRKILNNNLK